jgi:hypothetical protein
MPPRPRITVDVTQILTKGLRSVVGAYCSPCCVEGCDKLSLDEAAAMLTGGTHVARCVECEGSVCQGHLYLVPTAPPQARCADCIFKRHRVWRREHGLDKRPRRDFTDAEFVEPKK